MSEKNEWSRRDVMRAAGTAGVGVMLGVAETDPTPRAAHAAEQSAGANPAGGLPAVNAMQGPVLREEAREIPVAAECDVCVIGGSCTGVFAAVAAAKLGASVALIENLGFFGGVATASLVNIWHSTLDTSGSRQIIGGLTTEVIDRLKKRNAVVVIQPGKSGEFFAFNSAELTIELDELVTEAKVRPFLHTRFVAPIVHNGRVVAAVIEDKTGRRAIRAAYFIDASGDGDLLARIPLPTRKDTSLQPPTTCAIMTGLAEVARQNKGFDLARTVFDPRYPNSLKDGFLWTAKVPSLTGATMVAGTRVHGADCSDADQLTRAEIEGRRQVRAMCDILRQHVPGGQAIGLAALPARIGIRETRHAECLHTLTEVELLSGRRFPDAVANGTYRVDIHHADRPGLTFRYLDGREQYVAPGQPTQERRWREKTAENPTFYQIPYASLVPRGAINVLIAGRLLDADRGAFGATRVMVNCNQMGQAAGTAAYLALREKIAVAEVSTDGLRACLRDQGAVVL